MAKSHGPQIKDDRQYQALRRRGVAKDKAARIANTRRSAAGERGGVSRTYEKRSKRDLYEKAKEVGIEGRSKMSKGELIAALRR